MLASIWGASFMFVKVMLDEVSPAGIGWLRLDGGAVLIIGVVAVRQTPLPRDPRYWRSTLVVGALGSGVPFVLIPLAEEEISSQLAGILNRAMPLWAAIMAHAARIEEPLDYIGAFGLPLGFVGLSVVIGPGIFDLRRARRAH